LKVEASFGSAAMLSDDDHGSMCASVVAVLAVIGTMSALYPPLLLG